MGYLSDYGGLLSIVLITYFIARNLRSKALRRKKMRQHGCQDPPQYPHKDPILGIDFFLDNMRNVKRFTLLERWVSRYEHYGRTFSVNYLGTPTICTVDPLNLQTMLGADHKYYGVQPLRRDATLPFLGEGVFTMDGDFWQHSRNLLRPTFSKTNVANLPAFEVNLKKFFELLPRDGSTVDLKPLLCRLFIDTSTGFLFGESMDTLSANQPLRSQEFLDAFHYAQAGTGKRLQLGRLDFLHRDKKWRESIKVAHAFADYYVDKAIDYRSKHLANAKAGIDTSPSDESEQRYVLLNEMAMETDDRKDLRNQIIHVFLAGHESSAITIGNAIFLLCRNPEMWEKLRSEVLTCGEAPLTYDTLKGLRYLQNVVKETLRLLPVASTSRMAYKDLVLPTGGGPDRKSPIFVQKGTMVTTSLHALGRTAACFQPDPNTFRPERWEDLRADSSYMPFGWGPRTCPAKNLAEVEVAYVLARMAQIWKHVECRDEVMEWVEELRISTSSRNGTKVGLIY